MYIVCGEVVSWTERAGKEAVYDYNSTELIPSSQPADLGLRERVIHSQSEVNPTSQQPNSDSEMTTMPCRLERNRQTWHSVMCVVCGGEGLGGNEGGGIPEDIRFSEDQVFHTRLLGGHQGEQ